MENESNNTAVQQNTVQDGKERKKKLGPQKTHTKQATTQQTLTFLQNVFDVYNQKHDGKIAALCDYDPDSITVPLVVQELILLFCYFVAVTFGERIYAGPHNIRAIITAQENLSKTQAELQAKRQVKLQVRGKEKLIARLEEEEKALSVQLEEEQKNLQKLKAGNGFKELRVFQYKRARRHRYMKRKCFPFDITNPLGVYAFGLVGFLSPDEPMRKENQTLGSPVTPEGFDSLCAWLQKIIKESRPLNGDAIDNRLRSYGWLALNPKTGEILKNPINDKPLGKFPAFDSTLVFEEAHRFMRQKDPHNFLTLCRSDLMRDKLLKFAGLFQLPTLLSRIIEQTFDCTLSKAQRAHCFLCFLHYGEFTQKQDMYRVHALLWAYDQKEKRKAELTDPKTRNLSEPQALNEYRKWKENQRRLKQTNRRKQYQKKLSKGE